MRNFIERDPSILLEQITEQFKTETGETLYNGDSRKILLYIFAYITATLANDFNGVMSNNFAQYAEGEFLDLIGENRGVERLQAEAAKTIIKFTLPQAYADYTIIPAGTRVTGDGVIFFETAEQITIPDGATEGECIAFATVAGAESNNILTGSINTMVDLIPRITSAENTITSYGGLDIESDAAFRQRVMSASAAYSSAGPAAAYKFFALKASNAVGQAHVYSPSAGKVNIMLADKNGAPISIEIANAVAEYFETNQLRVLTDQLTVVPATSREYAINITYYIKKADADKQTIIAQAVAEAVESYKLQTAKIGESINQDALIAAVINAGAYRVTVSSPTNTILYEYEIPVCTESTVTYGGSL
ncbi:MAG: baseplate J/gp47 family protein [Selenomonadaceae bacterium]